MALVAANFSTLTAGVQQLHIYRSADAIATVQAADYFLALTSRLHQFDVILAVTSTSGTVAVSVLAVTAIGATVTTVKL